MTTNLALDSLPAVKKMRTWVTRDKIAYYPSELTVCLNLKKERKFIGPAIAEELSIDLFHKMTRCPDPHILLEGVKCWNPPFCQSQANKVDEAEVGHLVARAGETNYL